MGSILVADLKGSCKLGREMSSSLLVHVLNRLFTLFDELCKKHQVSWAINRGSTVDPPGGWAPSVASAHSVLDPYIA
jgi:hypothetical protein